LDRGSARRKADTYTQNKRTQTSMSQVGFEPTIPVFEWARSVHALHLAATVVSKIKYSRHSLTLVVKTESSTNDQVVDSPRAQS
jgi:hypothetical protein